MANLLPTTSRGISQDYQNRSQQQSRTLLDNAKAMASDYLQSMKQMAGGQPGQPMRTMQKEQMDINNALGKVNAYSNLSGKVPEMDYLKMVGLQNTFGPIAGQPTQDGMANALRLSSSLGGGGGSGGTNTTSSSTSNEDDMKLDGTQGERSNITTSKAFADAIDRYNANASLPKTKDDGTPMKAAAQPLYYTVYTFLADDEAIEYYKSQSVDIKWVIDELIRSVAKVTPEEFFGKYKSLYNLYNSKFSEV